MMGLDPWLWVALFVLLAYTIEAMTGFGSIVIALALGAMVLPIPELLPVLVPLNVVMTGYLTLMHWRSIDARLLTRTILPLMAIGTLAGYALLPWLGHALLQVLLGGLVLWFSLRQLWLLSMRRAPRRHAPGLARAITLGAGVTHGLFASGGPLLVAAMSGLSLPARTFRATLLSVWLILNALLTVLFIADGTFQASINNWLALLPVVFLGAWTGNRLHPHLNEQGFRLAIMIVLALTAMTLIATA